MVNEVDAGIRVSVIIPTWNGMRYLPRCLASTVVECANLDRASEVIVVDNGSSDGTVDFIRRDFPDVHLLGLMSNRGFAEPCDLGIRSARGEICILLNNDAWFAKGSLAKLIAFAEEGQYSIAGPTILNPDGTLQVGPMSIDALGDPCDADPRKSPFCVVGSAMLVRRQDYLDVGGFDCRFFAFVEEVDFQWRARLYGRRIGYTNESQVFHVGGVTAIGTGRALGQVIRYDEHRQYLGRRNALAMLLMNYSVVSLVRLIPLWFVSATVECVGAVAMKQFNYVRIYIGAIAWNVTNIGVTMRRRNAIQTSRIVSDREIRSYFRPPFARLRQAMWLVRHRARVEVQ